jgi:DNA-directed RNA polymerase subunit L
MRSTSTRNKLWFFRTKNLSRINQARFYTHETILEASSIKEALRKAPEYRTDYYDYVDTDDRNFIIKVYQLSDDEIMVIAIHKENYTQYNSSNPIVFAGEVLHISTSPLKDNFLNFSLKQVFEHDHHFYKVSDFDLRHKIISWPNHKLRIFNEINPKTKLKDKIKVWINAFKIIWNLKEYSIEDFLGER